MACLNRGAVSRKFAEYFGAPVRQSAAERFMANKQNLVRPERAMILAAGRGQRLRPLSDRLPKALMPAGGQALVERLLHALAAAAVREAVINLSWLGGMIRDRLGNGSRYGIRISYSDEGDSALETGGGIRKALPLLGRKPFWVVNADLATDFRFSAVQLRPDDLAWLMLVANPAQNPQGDFSLRGARVGTRGPGHTFAGISVLRPALFAGTSEERFALGPLLRRAADAGRVAGAVYGGYWADAGTSERLEAVRAAYRSPPGG